MKRKLLFLSILLTVGLMCGCTSSSKTSSVIIEDPLEAPLFTLQVADANIVDVTLNDNDSSMNVQFGPKKFIQQLLEKKLVESKYTLNYRIKLQKDDEFIMIDEEKTLDVDLNDCKDPVRIAFSLPKEVKAEDIDFVSLEFGDNRETDNSYSWEIAFPVNHQNSSN